MLFLAKQAFLRNTLFESMESKFFKGPLKDFLDSTSEWKFQREKNVSLLPFRFHVARLISISIWSTG